jgi:hypothetical protein
MRTRVEEEVHGLARGGTDLRGNLDFASDFGEGIGGVLGDLIASHFLL